MILKDYQETAVKKLIETSKELLRHRGKKLIFKSPTGSGKTIIMAEYLKRYVQLTEKREMTSFIWIAPRQLHIQSKDKLDKYFEDSNVIRCSFFEDLEDRRIGENEVLFFNWESINRKEGINIYIRENEQEFYLSKVLDNTREDGKKLILIIDESHFSTDTENANKLKELFDPELTIEVSATPVFIDPDGNVTVDINDVKDEGMIKKSIILNENIENTIENGRIITGMSKDADELVIEVALKKREELKALFKKENTDVNPLVVIQLPSKIRQEHEDLKNNIIELLKSKYNISLKNEKLGIYLSEEHENIESISVNNNKTEVLLFKQGIALGWDCPRAQILVLFREWHSEEFSIQTVGRIMRMPEPDRGHYYTEELNHAYVYTNLNNINLKDEIAKDMISIFTSKRDEKYKDINLKSYYILRQREKTRLSPLFIKQFLTIAQETKLKEKLNLKIDSLTTDIISNWKIENIDRDIILKEGGTIDIILDEMQMQLNFNHFVAECLHPYYPEDRSVGRVKEAIYKFFENALEMKYIYNQDKILKIVLSDQNIEHFKNAINLTKEKYKEIVELREKEIKDINWNVPEKIRFNEKYRREEYKKCIVKPYFTEKNWKTESKFIEYLENRAQNVEWWFKNGDRDAVYFAIPYDFENERLLFYVDFIVKMKDGSIGLLDTKSGQTLNDSKLKSKGAKMDSLIDYIDKNNRNGKNLFGGIVTNTDQKNYTGSWIIYKGKGEKIKSTDFGNWNTLEL